MAISAANVTTSGNSSDLSSYSTASITPSRNKLLLAWVYSIAATAPNTPTASGNGLTWVQVATILDSDGVRRLTLFRALGSSPSTGALTFDFGGQTQTGCVWSVVEYTGVNTTGSNGANAIVQFDTEASAGSVSSLTSTLAAFGSTMNATAGGFGYPLNSNAGDVGSGFTAIGEQFQGSPNQAIFTEFRNDNDTTVDITLGASSVPIVGIAVELASNHAPQFQAQSLLLSSVGSLTVNWPTHQTNDVALLFVESAGGEPVTLSTANGFVEVSNSPQATGTTTNGTRLHVFWCRATSGSMAAPVIADAGNHVIAIMQTYRNVVTSGNPWDTTGGGTKGSASTTLQVGGITTAVTDTLDVIAVTEDIGDFSAFTSNASNSSLASLTRRADSSDTAGNGGGIAIYTGDLPFQGNTGATTMNLTASVVNAYLEIALKSPTSTTPTVTSRTQTGKARIQLVSTKTQTGKARITNAATRTQAGKSRLTASTQRSQLGKGYIDKPQAQKGKASIRNAVSRPQTGIAAVKQTIQVIQLGLASLSYERNRTITGKAVIVIPTPRTMMGLANIRNNTGRGQAGQAYIIQPPNFEGKKVEYKVYKPDGTYVSNITKNVTSDLEIVEEMNANGSQVVMTLGVPADDFGEGVTIVHDYNVKIYVYDQDAPNGVKKFDGYISSYKPRFTSQGDRVDVTLLSYGLKMDEMYLEDAGSTTLTYNSQDPSIILRDIMDKFAAAGGNIDYTTSTIPLTGTTVSYTFNTMTYWEAAKKCLELAPSGWYLYIDQANNVLYFQQRVDTADYLFLLDKHIEELIIEKTIENMVNTVYFRGGDPGTGILYKKYTRPGSITTFGTKAISMVDERVTVTATASTMANTVLDNRSGVELRTSITIIDNAIDRSKGYDLESIILGKMAALGGAGLGGGTGTSLWDKMQWDVDYWDYDLANLSTVVIQITKLRYNVDKVVLDLSTVPPDVNKRIEDINRNLEASRTADNPATPS